MRRALRSKRKAEDRKEAISWKSFCAFCAKSVCRLPAGRSGTAPWASRRSFPLRLIERGAILFTRVFSARRSVWHK
jgi:hypothetical protein